MVQHHKRWLEARRARIKQDVDEPNGTYDNRAMVRFIAAWFLSEHFLGHGSRSIRAAPNLEVYVQRRGGLNISCATGVFEALEHSGAAADRKGDGLACGGPRGSTRQPQRIPEARRVEPRRRGWRRQSRRCSCAPSHRCLRLPWMWGGAARGATA